MGTQAWAPSGPPPGSLLLYAGSSAPAGYLLCDGAAVSRNTYAALFAIIGTAFGAGDGATTFNLPDLRGRFPIGAEAVTDHDLGEAGGVANHALSHSHGVGTLAVASHAHGVGTLAVASEAAHTHSVPAHFHGMGAGADLNISASGSHSHNVASGGVGATRPTLTGDGSGGSIPTDAVTHTHPAGNFAGRIGLVTGGVDGNAAMTSGAGSSHTHGLSGSSASVAPGLSGSTASQLSTVDNRPPYQGVNYIVKT